MVVAYIVIILEIMVENSNQIMGPQKGTISEEVQAVCVVMDINLVVEVVKGQ